MNRHLGILAAFALALVAAPQARAASATVQSKTTVSTQATTPTTTTATTTTASATGSATTVEASDPAVVQTQTDLALEAQKVDELAAKDEAKVAGRLAEEFGMTSETLLQQKDDLDASWGELMIAHTLSASADPAMTVEQMFDLRGQGQGWGRIAQDLGLNLGQTVKAVRQEAMVANGMARPDGKLQGIARGASVRAGSATKASVGVTRGSVNAGGAARVGAGVGAGAALGHTKKLGR